MSIRGHGDDRLSAEATDDAGERSLHSGHHHDDVGVHHVVEEHVRRLAAQFHGRGDYVLGSILHDQSAGRSFSGEGDLASVLLGRPSGGVRDLLDLPRPAPRAPWAYVKIAEGCDRACAFCAIPSFRGAQRSRTPESIFLESKALVEGGAYELVLVAQDLASYGRDTGNPGALAPLLRDTEPQSLRQY